VGQAPDVSQFESPYQQRGSCSCSALPATMTKAHISTDAGAVYFTDVFDVDAAALEEYGAFDISLINDPLFSSIPSCCSTATTLGTVRFTTR
jgi:hypothetical protein